VIIFMGVAGAGKSIQGRKLADALGLPWLSTGEFLRMLISGLRRIDMTKGKLLEDDEIISLVQKIFSVVDTKHEFILDGFPRTVGQADWLINQSKHGQLKISAVIHLKATPDVVKARLISRGRQDDTEEAIEERFKEYEKAVLPVIADLRKSGVKVYDIDGEQSVDSVHQQILTAVKGKIDVSADKD